MNAERTWMVIKDVTLFLGGMAGLTHQTLLTDKPNEWLLLVFAAMAGVPGLTSLWSLRTGSGNGPTTGPSSPSPPPASSPSSPLPPAPPAGGEA